MGNRTVHRAAGDALAGVARSSRALCCPAIECRQMWVAAGSCKHMRWAHLERAGRRERAMGVAGQPLEAAPAAFGAPRHWDPRAFSSALRSLKPLAAARDG
eukprot:3259504-Alexandrium_andersonii.AAC.1